MSDFLSLILRMFCFYPISYGDKAKGRLATCPFCFAGLPSVLFCWYACNSFSLLENYRWNNSFFHISFLLRCKHLKKKYWFFPAYTIKKKETMEGFVHFHYSVLVVLISLYLLWQRSLTICEDETLNQGPWNKIQRLLSMVTDEANPSEDRL